MQNLSLAVGLAVVFTVFSSPTALAASTAHRADASSRADAAARASRIEAVPANCIRQSCGKLWCWEMRDKGGNR